MKRKQSLLVIDTPKSCSECELSRYIFNVNGTFCSINGKEVSHIKTKPSTCPLQDTTELLEALEFMKIWAIEGTMSTFNYNQRINEYNKLKQFFEGVMKNE